MSPVFLECLINLCVLTNKVFSPLKVYEAECLINLCVLTYKNIS
jgi:hypothetical protein